VRVIMRVRDGALDLAIEDDGRGLPAVAAPGATPHYGLRAMRERAVAIGATLDLEAGPGGRGTAVRLRLPLAGHDPALGSPMAGRA
jgi:two-component system NarL family sensor kinase